MPSKSGKTRRLESYTKVDMAKLPIRVIRHYALRYQVSISLSKEEMINELYADRKSIKEAQHAPSFRITLLERQHELKKSTSRKDKEKGKRSSTPSSGVIGGAATKTTAKGGVTEDQKDLAAAHLAKKRVDLYKMLVRAHEQRRRRKQRARDQQNVAKQYVSKSDGNDVAATGKSASSTSSQSPPASGPRKLTRQSGFANLASLL
ncbi:hypothetical protein EIP91_000702 [Steccherinum ochraceum]|uniref:Uncharacterized protein n=1 Tax=Steccherinum ochraceum TaxID=92696 RepID=A0A4R0RJD3_9APHY|nr:hypothetical protein EIP91_000702 [Steccherinum ochraceum]